jgi:serine/threonine-protein kinase
MSMSVPPSGSTSKLAFPGAVIGAKYRLEEVVGYGGMGAVWSATHLGLGERVAIKLVSANFARSSDARRRFEMEAKAAAKIRSRHVPQVFDNGLLEDGTPFLAMELLRGESLAARLSRQGPVPLPEAVSIFDQCCRALTRAHSLGIIHRDIKPDNIYLAHSVDDDTYIVKVLDFGIAKFTVLADGEASSATRTGALLGTPLYMSPEQARGLRTIDARTDLYSLGLVAYATLTGKQAFNAESIGDLLLQICVQPLPRLLSAAAWLPPTMEEWFQRACSREPESRFATSQAFIESLRIAAGVSASPGAEPAVVAPQGAARRSGASWDAGCAPATTGAAFAGTGAPAGDGRRTLIAASALGGILFAVVAAIAVALVVRGRHAPANELPAVQTSSSSVANTHPKGSDLPSVALDPIAGDAAAVTSGSSRGPILPAAPASTKPSATVARGTMAPVTTTSSSVGAKPAPTLGTTTKPTGTIDLGY